MSGSVRRVAMLAAMLSMVGSVVLAATPLAWAGVPAAASVTVIKVTLPASDPQDFSFGWTAPGTAGVFELDTDGGDGTLQSQSVFGVGDQQLGAHGILEDVPTGWVLLGVECTGDADASIVGAQVNLDVDAAEWIVCTFTNAKLPVLTLTKVTVPASDPQDFYLDVLGTVNTTLDTDPTSLGIPDSETVSLAGAELGEKTIEETAVAGWTLTDIDCTEGSVESTDLADRTVTINLEADSNITCTFTNTKDVEQSPEPSTEPSTEPSIEPSIEPSPVSTQSDTDTNESAPASSPFSVGILVVALVLLSGVLVLTRPKRSGK